MDKFFANVYRGDPGILHANPDKFADIWIASAIFSACAWNNPYMWRLSNKFNWHDHAMLYEQYHLKKAMEKKQPYEYLWNKMPLKVQHAYYVNWPTYFP